MCEIVWKYHQWISQFKYIPFDTQDIHIRAKMAESQICEKWWKLSEILWRLMWNCVKVSPMNCSAQIQAFWYQACWNWPKMAEIGQIAWNCVKACVKLCESITNEFLGSSTCFLIRNMLKWPKNGWNSPNSVKIVWNCVNTHMKFFESITNEFLSLSTCILIPNMLKLAQKWLK